MRNIASMNYWTVSFSKETLETLKFPSNLFKYYIIFCFGFFHSKKMKVMLSFGSKYNKFTQIAANKTVITSRKSEVFPIRVCILNYLSMNLLSVTNSSHYDLLTM